MRSNENANRTNRNSGRRRTGVWRFSSPKVVALCQNATSTALLGSPNHHTTGSLGSDSIRSTTCKSYDAIHNEHELRIRLRISNVSNHAIVRFLRRSLFQAFCNEDLTAAHFCYVATRSDFDEHFIAIMEQKFLEWRLQREEEEEERQRQEVKPKRGQSNVRSHLKRKGAAVDSPCSVVIPSAQLTNSKNRKPPPSGIALDFERDHENIIPYSDTHRPLGLLQQAMNVCEPFTLDDYLDPYHDPYGPQDEEDNVGDEETVDDEATATVDMISVLVEEILQISSLQYDSPKETSIAELLDATSPRKSYRRRRQMNDVDTNYGSDDAVADATTWSVQPLLVTTPLHEVARLGHVELLKCMLQQRCRHQTIDLDIRNGCGRTVLHNVAGGLVTCGLGEAGTSMDVDTGSIVGSTGIGAPQNPMTQTGINVDEETTDENSTNNEASISQRLSRMVSRSGRWLSRRNTKSDKAAVQNCNASDILIQFGKSSAHGSRCSYIPIARVDRIQTTNLLLSWRSEKTASPTLRDTDEEVRTEDEMITAGEKSTVFASFTEFMGERNGYDSGGYISTNAVDAIMNRTALHYAAELGRADICDAILSSFYGTMLTILDSDGQTPCELAAMNNHSELAAYLEARSLLYVDPYGTDEELLSRISMDEMNHHDVAYYRHNLVAPFCCFETISRNSAEQQRETLIKNATELINQQVAEFYQQQRDRQLNVTVQDDVNPSDHIASNSNYIPDDTTSVERQDMTEFGQSDRLVNKPRKFFEAIYDVDDPALTLAKDQPKVSDGIYSTAVEIGIHDGHVEKLLSHHKWLVSDMVAAMRQNPFIAFKTAGVPIPDPPLPQHTDTSTEQYTCLICCDDFHSNSAKWKQMSGCGHGFCTACLVDYVTEHTNSSSTGYLVECPHHDCSALMSPVQIKDLVESTIETNNRLRNSAIDAFVVSAQDYTYCPYPGCGDTTVIHALYPKFVNPSDVGVLRLIGGVCTNVHKIKPDNKNLDVECSVDDPLILTYESVPDQQHYDLLDMVQPQMAHRFCFVCGEKRIHWPITCTQLQEWRAIITEQVGETNSNIGSSDLSNFNEIAQNLWMKTNTRPCPKCKAPIEKNEGCNHITCRNRHCKHQFCWICRADWSTHNNSTGGNYRCNRWVEQQDHVTYDGETIINDETRARVLAELETDPHSMDETYGTARHESRVSKKKSLEISRFLHHYERWCGHSDSAILEHSMRLRLCERLGPVVRKAIEYGGGIHIFGGKGISFVHSAFTELLECRSILQHSYVFGFLSYRSSQLTRQQSTQKVVFERIQSELELLTEQISDVVARTHIRASETQIVFLTKVSSGKRKELTNFMIDRLRLAEIDEMKQLHSNQVNLPGHRPTNIRHGDYSSDDDEDADAAEAIQRSLDTYEAATNRRFHYHIEDDIVELQDWACSGCTYINAGSVRRCEMCDTRRVN